MNRFFQITVAGETYEVKVKEINRTSPADKNNNKINKTKTINSNIKNINDGAEAFNNQHKNITSDSETTPKVQNANKKQIEAPMAGTILKLSIKNGDRVEAGEELMILEAMKMENEIRSPVAGTVKKINVTKGQSVDTGEVLIVLE